MQKETVASFLPRHGCVAPVSQPAEIWF